MNRKLYKIILFLIILFITDGLSAGRYVKIFLMPKFSPGEGKVFIRDIARVDSISDEAELIYNIPVNGKFFEDGYIDRKEISHILSNRFKWKFFIYGNAVKIERFKSVKENENSAKSFAILKGDSVKIVVKKGSLKIEIIGVSRSNGMVGDKVKVLTTNRKVISGKITGKNLVEIIL